MSTQGTQKTESTQKPLSEQYAALRNIIWPESKELFKRELEFFPGSTVGPRDQFSGQAQQGVRALQQPDFSQEAQSFIGGVLGGDFMKGRGQNPELDARFGVMSDRIREQYQRTVAPQTASRFAGAGRTGSGAHNAAMNLDQTNLGRALGETATNVYYQDFENRMNDRMQALGLAPGVRGIQHSDIEQARTQGLVEEAYSQRLVDDAIARFNFAQQEPESRLDRFQQRIITPGGYGTSIQQVPTAGNAGLSIGLGVMGLLGQLGGAGLMG